MRAQRPFPGTAPPFVAPIRSPNREVLLGGMIIVAAAVVAYSRTFSVPLVFDDVPAIADNTTIRHWSTALLPSVDTTAGGRPILNLSFAINYAISGTAVWSYHAFNLAIHILAGLTLFGIVRRTLALRADANSIGVGFSAALLWTLHPLQTESVTYIVQRAESLMGLFYLLTLYCFIRGAGSAGRSQNRWYILSVVSCVLGMGTKEVMVSAPVIALLYDRTFLAGSFREAWRRRSRVYAGLGATWLILLLLVLSTHGRGGSAGMGGEIGYWSYASTQFSAVTRYLKLSVWPHPLVFYYGRERVENDWLIVPRALFLVGLIAAAAWALIRPGLAARSLGFAGAWFFAILAPTSLVPIFQQTAAEHRMYLALIPIVLLVVEGIYWRFGRWLLPSCLTLSLVLLGVTLQRNADYRTELGLWADTVSKWPDNAYARYNYGLSMENMPGKANDMIAQYREALRLNPELIRAHINLGNALTNEGHLSEGLRELETSVQLAPNSAEAHNNLGNALEKFPNRSQDAIAQYQEALRLKPDYAKARINLGNALSAEGKMPEAISQYDEALRLKPDDAEGHYNLGNSLGKIPGRLSDAENQYEQAIRLNPGFAEAHNNLGSALTIEGRVPEAIAQFEEALRLEPNYPQAHNNLGNALIAEGRVREASAQFEEAVRLKPDYAEAHFNLGNAWAGMPDRMNDAIAQYQEALRLKPHYAEARINLGGALTAAGRIVEAVGELEESARLMPRSVDAHINLGNALTIEGRMTEAIEQYEEVLRLKPDSADAHYNLANALGKTDRIDEAIEQYEEAVHLQPNFLEAHFNLGVLLLRNSGHLDAAKAEFEEVLRLQPENDQAQQILSKIQAK